MNIANLVHIGYSINCNYVVGLRYNFLGIPRCFEPFIVGLVIGYYSI